MSRSAASALRGIFVAMNRLGSTPFLGSRAIAAGLLTRKQLRGKGWRRLLQDVYVRCGVPVDHLTRARAVALVLPEGAVISGRTAAWLYGGLTPRPSDPIEVTLRRDSSMKPRTGLTIRRALLPAVDIAEIAGVPVTTQMRTAFDIARLRKPGRVEPLIQAVAAVDALARQARLDSTELTKYATEHPGWRGVRLAQEVAELMDAGAESAPESRLRLTLIFGGLPRPVTQYTIRDRVGNFIARVDLVYPELRIAIEYDGEDHRDRWADDIVRQNRIVGAGWTLVRYAKGDLFGRPDAVVAQVRVARNMSYAA
jgi:very-short-patch-repair endonuclease